MARPKTGQDGTIAFLSALSAADHDGEPQRIDTHAAIVFLTRDRAYKLKRAVRLSYLDFTALESRHRACARELEVNAALAGDIYLACRPIQQLSTGELTLGPVTPARTLDWVVEMRRFPEENVLANVAERGELRLEAIEDLAIRLARFHRQRPPIEIKDAAGPMGAVLESVRQSLLAGKERLRPGQAETFAAGAGRALEGCSKLLNERALDGWVRRCHGDLHLGNVVLLDNRAIPFDAIEFDERIATIDVLYDLAFLVMDLLHHGLDAHANRALNRYLDYAGSGAHFAGLAAMAFFIALRAGVRAMVALDRARAVQGGGTRPASPNQDAIRHLDLAERVLQPSRPRMIAIGGLSGSGKSTVAAAIASLIGPPPGAVIVRSDVVRKQLAGVDPTERLPEAHYTREHTRQVYRTMFERARTTLAAGRSVILDAVFAAPDERTSAEALAREEDCQFSGIWLDVSEAALIERVTARHGDASDAGPGVVRHQLTYDLGPISWAVLSSAGTPEDVRRRVRDHLNSRR